MSYIKNKIKQARKAGGVVQYSKTEVELVNHYIDTEGCSVNQAIDRLHDTFRNINSPYYGLSLSFLQAYNTTEES